MKLTYNIVPWLSEMIDYFWDNRKELLKKEDSIEYPDYYGLPKRISNRLESHTVDMLQESLEWWMKNSKNKKVFAERLVHELSQGMIEVKGK